MRKILSGLLALCLLSLPLCTACRAVPQKYSKHAFEYFDTVTTITGYAHSQEEFDKVANEALELLSQYHRLFTVYHRYEGMENLCTVNELVDGAHRTVTVDRRIVDMLLYAKAMYAMTSGRVNVAMGSVLSLWHDYREEGTENPSAAKLPSMEALAEAAAHTDIDKVIIDEEACTVTLTDPEMRLDVGAIAKGYAVEMVGQALKEKNISGYVLNVGGNVYVLGEKGDGSPWTIGIQNPDEEAEDHLAYLHLTAGSVVTSGSYQRYYVVDGKRYHHIIDPETLLPAERYLSVSVVSHHSALGDALSTALFCMDLESGQTLIDFLPDVEAIWVLADGTQYVSKGFSNYTNPK